MEKVELDLKGLRHRVLSHGKSGTGKTYFVGTWPRVVGFFPKTEGGATTIQMMPREHYYEPGEEPICYTVKSLADVKDIAALAAREVARGAQTVAIDSATFTALILEKEVKLPGLQKWGEILKIMTDLRDALHELDAHVLWTAGTEKEKKVLIPGQTGAYLTHCVTLLFYHEVQIREGEAEFVIHTSPKSGHLARTRLGDTIPSPLSMYVQDPNNPESFILQNSPTYRAIEQALELKAS
jgi:hypothetical protein